MLHAANAEAAGLAISAVALLGLLAVWLRPARRNWRIGITLAAGVALGGIANVQTYSFLTGIYLAAFVTAAWAIIVHRHRLLGVISVLLPRRLPHRTIRA